MTDAWEPRWVVHPGELVAEELRERGWSQAELARRTGFTQKHVSRVVTGQAGIGPEFAIALARAFGTSARVWMRLQADYKLGKAQGHPQT